MVADGETGVLVPPSRPDLLADALVALAADGDRRAAMAVAATQRGRAISMAAAVARYEARYRELAS